MDINKILVSADNDKHLNPTAADGGSPCAKQRRRKNKKEPKKKSQEVIVLSREAKTQNNKNDSARNGIKSDSAEVLLLKQKLFESTKDLDKEKNTREMLESRVRSLNLELKNARETSGEDKQFCIDRLKDELAFEQKLRLSVQDDLSKSYDMIVSGENRVKVLEKQIESEKRASDSIKKKLQSAEEELESEKAAHHSMHTCLSTEKQKNVDLQTRLQREIAANVAVRMELQSMKGKRNQVRVEELKEELRLERMAADQNKAKVAEYVAVRMELQAANKKLHKQQEGGLIEERVATNEAHSKVEERTQSLLRMKRTDAEDKKDKLVRKLRKELHETRMKLKIERRSCKSVSRKRSSSSDWVQVAPTNQRQHAGLIPIIQSPRSVNMPPPTEASLPGSTAVQESSSPPSSALSSLFHFDEDDVSITCDKALEPLHDELTFIRSAYDSDEIIIEGNKVAHFLELTTGRDCEIILVAITVTIPHLYPASGVLGVKASIHNSSCSHEVRKCAIDALPELEEICMLEARANEGHEAIHPIFSVASGWANTDWFNVLSKELSISNDEEEEELSADICVALIYTHHIFEADKIQSVKKNASKLTLGGLIKVGKPGLILIEGAEADCDSMLEALDSKKHSSSFKIVGKVLRKVADADIDSCRFLPRKMEQLESKNGMEELDKLCEKLGLSDALNDVVSH